MSSKKENIQLFKFYFYLIITCVIFLCIIVILVFTILIYQQNNNIKIILTPQITATHADLNKKFTKQSAVSFSWIASAGYYAFIDSGAMTNILNENGWSDIYNILQFGSSTTSTYGFIGQHSGNNIIISFSGTNNFNNILTDLGSFVLEEYGNFGVPASVGSGFLSAWQSVSNAVLSYISDPSVGVNSQTIFWIIGHSLGGALATLCACALNTSPYLYNSQNIIQYTYASPIVGDMNFSNAFSSVGLNTYNNRIRNAYDIVPSLPASPVGDTFTQTQTQILLYDGTNNSYNCQYGAAEPPTPAQFDFLLQHQLTTYQVILSNCICQGC